MTRNASNSPWEPGVEDALIALWGNPENTTVQIAEILTQRFRRQFSKDMVIGKAHRLIAEGRLVGRPSPLKPRRTDAPQPAPVPRAPAPTVLPVTLKPRPTVRCCYPMTSGRPWVFCEAPVAEGKVYCKEHCEVSYVPRKPEHV